MPYNFVADSFRKTKLRSRLPSREMYLFTQNCHFAFLRPCERELRGNVRCCFRLIRNGLPIIDKRAFLIGVMAEELRVNIDWKSACLKRMDWPKISGRRAHAPSTILRIGKLVAMTFHMV